MAMTWHFQNLFWEIKICSNSGKNFEIVQENFHRVSNCDEYKLLGKKAHTFISILVW